MLILIAGVSGNLGHCLAASALRRGLHVRGLGRSPQKVDSKIADQLESFVTTTGFFDGEAILNAVQNVDAVICAYGATLDQYLEAQLFLLRQAEKAGVKVFHAQSWNFNWHRIRFGDMEYYDANISFCRHVELTSNICPVYVFSGYFGHRIYLPSGPGSFSFCDGRPTMEYWGDGQAKFSWTSMEDAAEFSLQILTTERDVLEGKGGFFCVQSGCNTVPEFAEAYEKVKGTKVELIRRGDAQDLENMVAEKRQKLGPKGYPEYLKYVIVMLAMQGKWVVEHWRAYDGIPRTTLRDILQDPQATSA